MKSIYEFLLKSKTVASTQDNDCIDLGLPSGLLWAKCNIGADDPTEYGDYFMWGSTELDTTDKCDWKYAPFNNGKSQFNDDYFESIKNKICPNGVLVPECDAASVILGPDWRLPTGNEFQELIDNTKHKWVENYQGSNVNGMIFTPVVFTPVVFTPKNGEAAKANGAELFIPASGYRIKSGLYDRGSSATLWSSSLYTSSPNYARFLYFNDYSCNINWNNRYAGFCLRGVKNK